MSTAWWGPATVRAASPRCAACICHVALDASCLEVEIMYLVFLIWEEKKSWGNIFFFWEKNQFLLTYTVTVAQ